jgi:hypothetical protein
VILRYDLDFKFVNLKEVFMSDFKFFVCLIMGFFVFVTPVSLIGGETKISMLLWNRYTSEIVDNEVNESKFTLERGYFRIEPTITDNIDGRFNLDFFSDETSTTGGGVRVKYAYLNFKDVLPIPDSKISAGIIQHYFGFGYDWEYITIEKVLEEVEGVAKSADYGIAFCGNLPSNKGVYAVSVYNGEGYTSTGSDLDRVPEFLGNLRVVPVSGFTVGGSILYENNDNDRLAYIGLGRFSRGAFEFRGEYLVRNMNDVTSSGFMLMPILKLRELINIDVDIVGRYDMWDLNVDIEDDGHMRIIGGLNWNIVRDAKDNPQVVLQIQAQKTGYESAAPDVNLLMAQLRWGFGNILPQMN